MRRNGATPTRLDPSWTRTVRSREPGGAAASHQGMSQCGLAYGRAAGERELVPLPRNLLEPTGVLDELGSHRRRVYEKSADRSATMAPVRAAGDETRRHPREHRLARARGRRLEARVGRAVRRHGPTPRRQRLRRLHVRDRLRHDLHLARPLRARRCARPRGCARPLGPARVLREHAGAEADARSARGRPRPGRARSERDRPDDARRRHAPDGGRARGDDDEHADLCLPGLRAHEARPGRPDHPTVLYGRRGYHGAARRRRGGGGRGSAPGRRAPRPGPGAHAPVPASGAA